MLACPTALARKFGPWVQVVESYAARLTAAFDGTGARMIDLDAAPARCPVIVALVDHDLFRAVPPEQRAGKAVLETRGIWPDQPRRVPAALGLAS